jgi:hypothetical protein
MRRLDKMVKTAGSWTLVSGGHVLDSCANNGQTCGAIVALVAGHGKLSQNKVEEQLMATGVKRNLIRSAYRLLEHYDVIKAGQLTGPDAYDKMKARLDW